MHGKLYVHTYSYCPIFTLAPPCPSPSSAHLSVQITHMVASGDTLTIVEGGNHIKRFNIHRHMMTDRKCKQCMYKYMFAAVSVAWCMQHVKHFTLHS